MKNFIFCTVYHEKYGAHSFEIITDLYCLSIIDRQKNEQSD